MKYCKKCGAELSEGDNFCTSCGSPCDFNKDESINDPAINSGSKKTLKIIGVCAAVLAVLCIAGGVFYKITLMKKTVENSRQIRISSIKADNYPQVEISIKAENFEGALSEDKLSVKENNTYAKDLKLSKEDNNKYSISYKSGNSTDAKINVVIAYDDNGTEKKAEASYEVKAKDEDKAIESDSGSNKIVETHDSNEDDISYAINDYEDSYIRMINNRNTSYITSSIDLNGSLLNEFESLIKSYDDQEISEDLIDHNIEAMNKINDNQYEVTVHERYDIYYGEEECEKIIEYRTIYVVNNTDEGFKVSAIKKITQLSTRTL